MTRLYGVDRRSKRAREALDDVDYAHKLNAEEQDWLRMFLRGTTAGSLDDMAELVGHDKRKLAKLSQEIAAERDASERDLMTTCVNVRELSPDNEEFEDAADKTLYSVRCDRCLKLSNRCTCPARQRHPRYSPQDYQGVPRDEDVMLGELDLKRRMQAYDLLPYGTSPRDLEQGHTVKICLPMHALKEGWGYVLDYRPMTDEYLIRVMDRVGLKDKDGKEPKAVVCWVKPSGLRRFKLQACAKDSES